MSGLAKVPLTLDSLLLDGDPPAWSLTKFCAWALQTRDLSEAPIRSVLRNRQGAHEFVLISCDVNTAHGEVTLWLRIERHPSNQGVRFFLKRSKPTNNTVKASTNLQALREPCEALDSFTYNPNQSPPERLKFKHITEICHYFTGDSSEYSLLAANCRWICYALFGCLQETQPCYGGIGLHLRAELSTAEVRAVHLVISHYLRDKHPTCCWSRSYVDQASQNALDTTKCQDLIYRTPMSRPFGSSRRELDQIPLLSIPEQATHSFSTLEPLLRDDIVSIPFELPLATFCDWVLQEPKLTEAPVRQVLCNRQDVHEFILISCDVGITTHTIITLWLRIERVPSSQGVAVLSNKAKDTVKASTNLQALREPCEALDSFMYNPHANSREVLKLKHIAEMYQYFIGHSLEYSLLLGASCRICYALLECLRETQPCYGGTWLPSRTERSGADFRAAQLAKSHYLKDKHPVCCGSQYLTRSSFGIHGARASPASNFNQLQDNSIPRPKRRNAIDDFGANTNSQSFPTASTSCQDCAAHDYSSTRLPLPQPNLPYFNPSHQPQLNPLPINYNQEPSPQYISGPTPSDPQKSGSATERQSYDDPINAASVQVVDHHSGDDTETPEITELKSSTSWENVSKICDDSSEIQNVKVVIDHTMTSSEISGVLEAHGCENLSKKLDPSTCSEFPLSSGGLGDVYQAKIDGIDVAIKTTRLHLIHKEGKKHLKHAAKELHTWSKCQHPNVIKLAGFVEFRGQIGMVSRWMGNGNAPTFIGRRLEVDRCEMCRGICDGLAYLHFIGIIHGDLKGANVLIADNGNPMLSDFGNSVLCDQSLLLTQTTPQGCISARWTAPEIIDGTISCSYAADIYALGMTLLEVITGKPPFCHLLREQAVYHAIAFKKEIPPRPESCIPSKSRDGDAFWSLLVDCWAYESEKRPLAADTQSRVKHITHDGLKDFSADALADSPDP